MDCRYLVPDHDPWDPYSPNINTTLPHVFIVQAVGLSVVFPLSFVGMVLNIVFICRRKTNFLVRRIVYMTVITTLQLGALWLWSIPAFKPDESMFNFCYQVRDVYISVAYGGGMWIMVILICSIYFTLVTKLCGCFLRRRPWSYRLRLLLECIFVMTTLLVGFVFSVLAYYLYIGINTILYLTIFIIILVIPSALILISLMGNVVLTIWFCTLWRRQIARRRDVLKDIGIFFALFFFTLFVFGLNVRTLFITPAIAITQIVLSSSLSCFPLLVFGYMCYSFRSRTRHVRFANRADIETAGPGLRTAPPSTRVSLPTDTADHAPNFLSPSTAEPSEVTPLMN